MPDLSVRALIPIWPISLTESKITGERAKRSKARPYHNTLRARATTIRYDLYSGFDSDPSSLENILLPHTVR